MMAAPVNMGRGVKYFRLCKDWTQDALAMELGWDQKRVSTLEKRKTIDDETLEQVAKALGVEVEDLRNFQESSMHNLFTHNTFHGHTGIAPHSEIATNANITFNDVKEMLEEMNKRHEAHIKEVTDLYDVHIKEVKDLYERLLKSEGKNK